MAERPRWHPYLDEFGYFNEEGSWVKMYSGIDFTRHSVPPRLEIERQYREMTQPPPMDIRWIDGLEQPFC